MYNMPDDFNKEHLVGLEVQQISFASNNIVINFSQKSHLQIECGFSLTINGQQSNYDVNESIEIIDLLKLLNKKITSVEIQNNNLTVVFEDENSLAIFPESNYESYFIVIDSIRTII